MLTLDLPYDVALLARDFDFDGELLCRAIRATTGSTWSCRNGAPPALAGYLDRLERAASHSG